MPLDGQGRQRGRRSPQPPRTPAAGRAIGFRRLAGHTPARIFGDAIGEREREPVRRLLYADGRDLRVAEALLAAGAIRAEQFGGIEAGLAADRILHQSVSDAVLRIAGREHGIMHELDLGGTDPTVAHGQSPAARWRARGRSS